MPDWEQIKAEYISDASVSIRKLAAKYHVSPSMAMKISAREHWADLRKQVGSKTEAKIVDKIASGKARQVCSVISVADKVLASIERKIDNGEYEFTAQEVRQITGALKDLKEIKSIKSDADMREQEARIRKLEREATVEDTDKDIHIVISSDAEDYCG